MGSICSRSPAKDSDETADNKAKSSVEELVDDTTVEIKDNVRIIHPSGFTISWGSDHRYWKVPEKGVKNKPAELLQVCWLQVTGAVEVEHGKSYEIKFRMSFTPEASGWDRLPLFIMAKIGDKGKYISKKINPLDKTKIGTEEFEIPEDKFIIQIPKDGDKKLCFGFYEIWSNEWKRGLLVHNATITEVSSGN